MDADDLLRRIVDHQLVERALIAAGKDILHRPEITGVGLYLPQLVARFPLGHPDTRNRRMRKDRVGDAVMVNRPGRIAELRVGESMALADRDGGQLDAVGDVADGEDGGYACPAVFVDLDLAPLAHLNAGLSEAQPLHVRYPAGREQNCVGPDIVAAGHHDVQFAIPLLDAVEGGVESKLDPLGHRDLQ